MRKTALSAAVLLWATPGLAATPDEVDRLLDALSMEDLIEVMAVEGIDHGEAIRLQLLGGAVTPQWDTVVATLYDAGAMFEIFRKDFAKSLEETEAAPLLDFFESDLGQRIVRLEIEARRAMLDESIEEVAGERAAQMRDEGDPRLEIIDEFVAANDLIELNVVGALNSNFAFYRGLASGEAFEDLTEGQILADVWSQEEDIRLDSGEWLQAFLTMAYRPLADEELRAYVDMAKSDAGRALNEAFFGAFDQVYVTISNGLGLAVSQLMSGQDI